MESVLVVVEVGEVLVVGVVVEAEVVVVPVSTCEGSVAAFDVDPICASGASELAVKEVVVEVVVVTVVEGAAVAVVVVVVVLSVEGTCDDKAALAACVGKTLCGCVEDVATG